MDKKQKGNIEVVLSVIILVALIAGSYFVDVYKCSNYQQMSGMQTKYKVFDGCYVQTDKGWFLREQLRDVSPEITKEK